MIDEGLVLTFRQIECPHISVQGLGSAKYSRHERQDNDETIGSDVSLMFWNKGYIPTATEVRCSLVYLSTDSCTKALSDNSRISFAVSREILSESWSLMFKASAMFFSFSNFRPSSIFS